MPKLFWVLILGANSAMAQTVEGRVVNSVTGVGVAGVKGSYTASYSSQDFWDESEAPWREREARHPFQVTTGKLVRLEARLIPLARINGRVIDGRGEAVPNARLELTRSGTRQVASTDANGKFDLHVFSLALIR